MDSEAIAASSAAATAQRTFCYKLVLLGDTSVGKSCMVVRFASDEFFEDQEATIGAAFVTQVIDLPDCTVKFDIWDTAGAERYRSLTPMYYRGAVAAVVVYDITSMESFEGAKTWIEELQGLQAPQKVLVIALCGNKCDLDGPARRVDAALAKSFAEKHGLIFMETSAKSGRNVTEVFHLIAKNIPKTRPQDNSGGFELGKKKPEDESSGWCGC